MRVRYLGTVLGLSLGPTISAQAENLPSIHLTAKDGYFSPEQLAIPAGQKIKVVVKNDGPGPEEFESSELNREKMIMPGKSADIVIGPLKAGVYGFYGEFHPKTVHGQIVAK